MRYSSAGYTGGLIISLRFPQNLAFDEHVLTACEEATEHHTAYTHSFIYQLSGIQEVSVQLSELTGLGWILASDGSYGLATGSVDIVDSFNKEGVSSASGMVLKEYDATDMKLSWIVSSDWGFTP